MKLEIRAFIFMLIFFIESIILSLTIASFDDDIAAFIFITFVVFELTKFLCVIVEHKKETK